MACYSAKEIQELLFGKPYLQEKLYTNGFLITDDAFIVDGGYPFFNNWSVVSVQGFSIYTHKSAILKTYKDGCAIFFMIGHAVDPFDQLFDEMHILKKLANAFREGTESYYRAQNDLTGIFCTGVIFQNNLFLSNDSTGMQIVYYGTVAGNHYFSSHSKLVADLVGLSQSHYIERLVGSRFYHYMGTWLPGDLSPYSELCRLVPNHYVCLKENGTIDTIRFFPDESIMEDSDPDAYNSTICWLSDVMHETLSLYAKKWADKKIAISVTGGRDSTTTLACAKGLYDKFKYFSYISNEPEKVDALAARDICQRLDLKHEIYVIPPSNSELKDVDAFAAVLECNAGCIGKNNPNDVRKRLYFIQKPKYDIEIKSWVNELGRGSQYVKYNKKRFPNKPTASFCRALHKIYISPKLIHDTDKVFHSYLEKYYPEEVLKKAPWMELYWWEFCWSGGEGIFLTAEQRTSSEIAIPYNNRRYIEKMLTVPLEKRRTDAIPKDIIAHMNDEISNTGIVIKDLEHTDKRALIMRLYLEVFSRIHF